MISQINYAMYLITNGNDWRTRKLAGMLFGRDFSSFTSAQFSVYSQIIWFLTALNPFECSRVFPKVGAPLPPHTQPYAILTANETAVTPQMKSYFNRLLPYLMVNVTRRHITLTPPSDSPRFCARHAVGAAGATEA